MRKELHLHPTPTPRQKDVLRSRSDFLLLTGPAGTAKTYTALARGLRQLYDEKVSKIIVIRSAVATREIGFLPGSQDEKLAAFMAPYVAIINDLTRNQWKALDSKHFVEFHSTSFLRGLTFDDCYIVVDEYQNLTAHELETAITRVGENTQLVLCGDSDQSDLTGREANEHREVISTLMRMPSFECHHFTVDDIVRSQFVREYYAAKAWEECDPTLGTVHFLAVPPVTAGVPGSGVIGV